MGQVVQVAAVQADGLNVDVRGGQFPAETHHFMGACHRVIGVDEQHDIAQVHACEVGQGFALVVMGLDQRMGHGAVDGDTELLIGCHGSGAREAGDVAGSGRIQGRLGTVSAAHAEIHQHLVRCRHHAPDRLAGNHGLKVHQVDDATLRELGLGQAGLNPEQGFFGEGYGTLRHGRHAAVETKARQVVQKIVVEQPRACQIAQLLWLKCQVLQVVEHLLQATGHQEVAFPGQTPNLNLKDGRPQHVQAEVMLQHGELIEIREQRVTDQELAPPVGCPMPPYNSDLAAGSRSVFGATSLATLCADANCAGTAARDCNRGRQDQACRRTRAG